MEEWLVAFISLLFLIFSQIAAGIWWASRLQTKQEQHSEWIAAHESQQKDYPVLQNRVTNLEAGITELVQQMKEFLKEIRGMKEHHTDDH